MQKIGAYDGFYLSLLDIGEGYRARFPENYSLAFSEDSNMELMALNVMCKN
jgi:hypothetical protein